MAEEVRGRRWGQTGGKGGGEGGGGEGGGDDGGWRGRWRGGWRKRGWRRRGGVATEESRGGVVGEVEVRAEVVMGAAGGRRW